MSKKFSQFTAQLTVLLTDGLVGIKSSDNMITTIQAVKDAINSAGGTVTGDVEIVGAHKAQTYQGNGALVTAVPSAGVGGTSSESSLTLLCNSGNANPLSKVVASKFSVDLFEADENGFVLKSSIPYSHEDAAIPFDKDLNLQGKEFLDSKTIQDIQPFQYAHFNGTSSYGLISDNINLNFGLNSFTILKKFAFHDNSGSDLFFILDKRAGTANGYYLTINTDLKFEFNMDTGGPANTIVGNNALTKDTIYSAVCRYDATTNTMSMFIEEGIQTDTSVITPVSITNAVDLYFGADDSLTVFSNISDYGTVFFSYALIDEYAISLLNPSKSIDWIDEGGSNVNILTGIDADWGTDVANFAAFNAAYTWQAGGVTVISVTANVVTAENANSAANSLVLNSIAIIGKRYRLLLNITSINNPINVMGLPSETAYDQITAPGLHIVEFVANNENIRFRPASSVSTTIVIDASAIDNELTKLGATLELKPQDMSPIQAKDNANGLICAFTDVELGNTSLDHVYQDKYVAIADNDTFDVPEGCSFLELSVNPTTPEAATTIRIGTGDGLQDVVADSVAPATANMKPLTMLLNGFSAGQTLYIGSDGGAAWSALVADIHVRYQIIKV